MCHIVETVCPRGIVLALVVLHLADEAEFVAIRAAERTVNAWRHVVQSAEYGHDVHFVGSLGYLVTNGLEVIY